MNPEIPGRSHRPVRANEGRDGDSFAFLNGAFHLKVSAADSGGGLCIFDTIRHTPGGPPLHVHHAQDEWFFVTEGIFDVCIGEEIHRLHAGDSIFAPRGIRHAFRNISPTGRLMVAFQPAGSMEAFFAEGSARGPLDPAAFAELSARHGMTVVGPPLGPDGGPDPR